MACGSSFLVNLADDILNIIGRSLSTRDICNISMCCKRLNAPATFDQTWHTHCEELGVLSSPDLVEWRRVMLSYKALCRYLNCVKPLLGIWVCRNPELGNVVYVMPGFASVVGCRVIPQKIGPLGIEGSPILWAPVFEVISDNNGAPTFILHGKEKGQDHHYIYPGVVKSIDKTCNVLLLEVDPQEKKKAPLHSDEGMDRQVSSSDTATFNKLSFENREQLLEVVTRGVQVPDPPHASLFPCLRGDKDRFHKDVVHLSERRAVLIEMHKLGGGFIDWTANHGQQFLADQTDLSENEDTKTDDSRTEDTDQIDKNENKYAKLDDFLSSGDIVGLALHASTMNLFVYKTWSYLNENLFALVKLPVQSPTIGQEYAGLWGGTFGWPIEAKPGKAFCFLNLSYYRESGKTMLLASKILEGHSYAKYPNGSPMFTVNIGRPSAEPFPWSTSVKQAFTGKGIASGYGFRYPSSKPGSLFVFEEGLLAFLWTELGLVLTLQRLDLNELLKKGQRVPALPPVNNFSYLERSYSNVFVDL